MTSPYLLWLLPLASLVHASPAPTKVNHAARQATTTTKATFTTRCTQPSCFRDTWGHGSECSTDDLIKYTRSRLINPYVQVYTKDGLQWETRISRTNAFQHQSISIAVAPGLQAHRLVHRLSCTNRFLHRLVNGFASLHVYIVGHKACISHIYRFKVLI